jgi:hypothetical protein
VGGGGLGGWNTLPMWGATPIWSIEASDRASLATHAGSRSTWSELSAKIPVLAAGDERPLRRVGVHAEPHVDVGEVDPRVCNIDRDLIVAGWARRDLARGQRRGGSDVVDHDVAVHAGACLPMVLTV